MLKSQQEVIDLCESSDEETEEVEDHQEPGKKVNLPAAAVQSGKYGNNVVAAPPSVGPQPNKTDDDNDSSSSSSSGSDLFPASAKKATVLEPPLSILVHNNSCHRRKTARKQAMSKGPPPQRQQPDNLLQRRRPASWKHSALRKPREPLQPRKHMQEHPGGKSAETAIRILDEDDDDLAIAPPNQRLHGTLDVVDDLDRKPAAKPSRLNKPLPSETGAGVQENYYLPNREQDANPRPASRGEDQVGVVAPGRAAETAAPADKPLAGFAAAMAPHSSVAKASLKPAPPTWYTTGYYAHTGFSSAALTSSLAKKPPPSGSTVTKAGLRPGLPVHDEDKLNHEKATFSSVSINRKAHAARCATTVPPQEVCLMPLLRSKLSAASLSAACAGSRSSLPRAAAATPNETQLSALQPQGSVKIRGAAPPAAEDPRHAAAAAAAAMRHCDGAARAAVDSFTGDAAIKADGAANKDDGPELVEESQPPNGLDESEANQHAAIPPATLAAATKQVLLPRTDDGGVLHIGARVDTVAIPENHVACAAARNSPDLVLVKEPDDQALSDVNSDSDATREPGKNAAPETNTTVDAESSDPAIESRSVAAHPRNEHACRPAGAAARAAVSTKTLQQQHWSNLLNPQLHIATTPLSPTPRKAPPGAAKRKRRARYDLASSEEEDADNDDDGPEQEELGEVMSFVDHLHDLSIDCSTGLPVLLFTAYAGTDEIIYDFRVDIRQSQIQGAGHGAFLTFLRGRRLKPESRQRNQALIDAKWIVHDAATKEELHAMTAGGYHVSVKLEGDDLHGNNNIQYTFIQKDTGALITPHLEKKHNPIGFLGVYTEGDYEHDPSIEFSQHDSSIYLGRYGPFLKSDRKEELYFDLKNFIFSGEPAVWAFGVDERLRGHKQLIDITDDTTGSPHSVAQQNICMYVNEVGHDKNLTHTVHLRDQNDRTVAYYVRITEPMVAGSSIELLTNYGEGYEEVRERKGYGLKNVEGSLRNDKQYLLRRSLEDRREVERDLDELVSAGDCDTVGAPILALQDVIEFVVERVWVPLRDKATDSGCPCSRLTASQWVALHRMQWLRKLFDSKISQVQAATEKKIKGRETHGFPYMEIFDDCRELVQSMAMPVSTSSQQGSNAQCNCQLITRSIRDDSDEAVMHDLQKRLFDQVDTALWCPVARDLLSKLRQAVCEANATTETATKKCEVLKQSVFAAAKKFADETRLLIKCATTDRLAFDSGLDNHNVELASFSPKNLADSWQLYIGHSTTSKCLTSAIIDRMAQINGNAEGCGESNDINVESKKKFLMVSATAAALDNGCPSSLARLSSIPRSVGRAKAASDSACESWYLVWQVAYPAHCFARRYLGRDYNPEALCRTIGIEPALFDWARQQQIRDGRSFDHENFLRYTGTARRSSKRFQLPPPSHGAKPLNERQAKRRCLGDHAKNGVTVSLTATSKQANNNSSSTRCSSVKKAAAAALAAPKQNRAMATARMPTCGGGGQKLIREGPPDVELLGIEGGWPPGWWQETYQRRSGATIDRCDRYWFTPAKRLKIRSLKRVRSFIRMMNETCCDEYKAWSATGKG